MVCSVTVRWCGLVTRIETGVCVVEVAAGQLRASWSGRMLAAVARDRAEQPQIGDRVEVMLWPDGRVTLERVLRATGSGPTHVVPLRRRA